MINELLMFEEGYRPRAYMCSTGHPTIGIGTKLGPKNAPLSHYTFTVSEKAAKAMLDDELLSSRKELIKHRWYTDLNPDRQDIIKSMAYQIGIHGLFKFKKMIAALERKDWSEAEIQALDSLWARQTPKRASRHAEVLRTGDLMATYRGLI